MVNRDLVSNILAALSIAPAANRTATTEGTGVDLRGFDSAAVIFNFGVVTDGGWTIGIEESDDDSTYTAVAADDIIGTPVEVVDSTDVRTYQLGYRGSARYIRAVVTESTASTTGALFSATVVRGDPLQAPAA